MSLDGTFKRIMSSFPLSEVASLILEIMEAIFTALAYISALPLEKAMATHSSSLAWKIPWAEEPGRLQSMGLLGVGHD